MTEPIKDGGPAFPCDPFIASKPGNETVAKRLAEGMSLRDYFAAKAMQGMLADRETILAFANNAHREMVGPNDLMATASYGMAEAMLRARSQGEPDAP